jgi:hypothetical protein
MWGIVIGAVATRSAFSETHMQRGESLFLRTGLSDKKIIQWPSVTSATGLPEGHVDSIALASF